MRLLTYSLIDFDTVVIRNVIGVLQEAPFKFPHWFQILQILPGVIAEFPWSSQPCRFLQELQRIPKNSSRVQGGLPESHRALKASRLPCQEPDRALQSSPRHPECPKTLPQLPKEGVPPGARQSPPELPRHPECPKTSPQLPRGSSRWSVWAQTWSHTGSKQNKKKQKNPVI